MTYQSILNNIVHSVAPNESPLALLSNFAPDPEDNNESSNTGVYLSSPIADGLDEFDVHICDYGTQFVETALETIRNTTSTVSFAHPPLIGGNNLPKSWRDAHRHLGVAEVFAEQVFSTTATEKLILLIPKSLMQLRSLGAWRQAFFKQHSVIIIEHDFISIGSDFVARIPFVTIVLSKEPGLIKFFKIPKDTEISEDRIHNDLKQLIKQPAGKTRLGYVYEEDISPQYPCSFDFYSEETERLRNESSILGEKVRLDEIADVILPFRPVREEHHGDQNLVTNFYYLNARSITVDGRVILDDKVKYPRLASHVNFLEDGDFILRKIFKHSDEMGFVLAIYEADKQQIAFNTSLIVVRPKASMTTAQRHVLYSYLRSPVAGRLNVAKGRTLLSDILIQPSMLKEYPVPLAGKEVCSAMEALTKARESFELWRQECLKAEQTIVMMSDAEDAKSQLLTAGQLARQRRLAGEQVEYIDFRIRTQYPHPIAYLWRESQIGTNQPYLKFKNILKAAEAVTCFMATIAILMAKNLSIDIKYLNTIARRLSGKSGTNFGDWFAILEEVNTGKAFRKLTTADSFYGVAQLFSAPGFEESLRSLMLLRNDDSHGRITHSSVTVQSVEENFKLLSSVYASIEFCTDLKLIQVVETTCDSLLKKTTYRYLDLTGDHPLPPEEQAMCNRTDLERLSLYLVDQHGELHLLRPLIQYMECPECHQMSTFYLDTYQGSGRTVALKSFERGTTTDDDSADVFRAVGLLQ